MTYILTEEDWALLERRNPSRSAQAHIRAAIAFYPPDENAWDRARQLLSGSQWDFSGSLELEDTTDGGFHSQFARDDLKIILSGIAYQQLRGNNSLAVRAVDMVDQNGTITMSETALAALRKLVPSLQAETTFTSAGHTHLPGGF